jgi:hypothetical protein
MYYEPYGPFFPRQYLTSSDRNWKDQFWCEVEGKYEDLSRANGVYVFSLRFGKKYTPWYVGKTCTSRGFRGEVFQGHKLDHYFKAADGRRGEPTLHLVARVEKNRGNFCNDSSRARLEIDRLETYLIGMALSANPDLRNNHKTKFLRALDIAGVIGPKYDGRPYEDARTLRRVFDL